MERCNLREMLKAHGQYGMMNFETERKIAIREAHLRDVERVLSNLFQSALNTPGFAREMACCKEGIGDMHGEGFLVNNDYEYAYMETPQALSDMSKLNAVEFSPLYGP